MEIKGHIVDVLARKIVDGVLKFNENGIIDIVPAEVGEHAHYIMPGFIDGHMHVESTLLLPENFARIAVTRGSVGAVTDPHEIANVLGVDGVKFMIDNGEKVRFNFAVAASPCVPSTCFETSGATMDVEDVKELLAMPQVYGLGEMMNVPGVLYEDPAAMAKINAAHGLGKPVDGHSPGLVGDGLKKYVAAGISTDHECITIEEAHEKLAAGMKLLLREGSAACNFNELWPLLLECPEKLMLCSDDKYPNELLDDGYLDALVRMALDKGVPLWNVLQAACVNPVRHYGLDVGLLQKGDSADFIIVDSLDSMHVLATYIKGVLVYDVAGGVMPAIALGDAASLKEYPNCFDASPITAEDVRVKDEGGPIKVMKASDGSLYTGMEVLEPKVVDGYIVPNVEADVLKIVVYNRYTPAKPAVGFIKGFGLKKGVLGTTIAHDSHNIIVVGTSDEEIATAVNKLISMRGGIVVGSYGDYESLALPVAGLMSPLDGYTVATLLSKLRAMAHAYGCPFSAPFMTLSFMALPVIPELKLTDKGLFLFKTFNFTELQ